MAALENILKLLQHSSKICDLPAEEAFESRSNTSQANTLTIRPEALSSTGCLRFSTPTTTITSRHYWPSCSGPQHEGRMLSFTAVYFHSSCPRQVPRLVSSPKCQGRSSVASTLTRLIFVSGRNTVISSALMYFPNYSYLHYFLYNLKVHY